MGASSWIPGHTELGLGSLEWSGWDFCEKIYFHDLTFNNNIKKREREMTMCWIIWVVLNNLYCQMTPVSAFPPPLSL